MSRRLGLAKPGDASLRDLVDELCRTQRSLADLLNGEGRDASDIPGYDALADRLASLAEAVSKTPADGLEGVLAKAYAVTPSDAAMRREGTVSIAMSIVADLAKIGGGTGWSAPGALGAVSTATGSAGCRPR